MNYVNKDAFAIIKNVFINNLYHGCIVCYRFPIINAEGVKRNHTSKRKTRDIESLPTVEVNFCYMEYSQDNCSWYQVYNSLVKKATLLHRMSVCFSQVNFDPWEP